MDIAGPAGTPLYPVHAGVVTQKFYDPIQAGNAVDFGWDDQQGRHEVRYCHLLGPAVPNVGDAVSKATLLGFMGSTGLSTGDHVHIVEWVNDVRVDPEQNCLKEDTVANLTIIDLLDVLWNLLSAIQQEAGPGFITDLAEDAKQNGVVELKKVIGLE